MNTIYFSSCSNQVTRQIPWMILPASEPLKPLEHEDDVPFQLAS